MGIRKRHQTDKPKLDTSPDALNGEITAKLSLKPNGKARIIAPGTPWDELDLSETFLQTAHLKAQSKSSAFWNKRRVIFTLGGIVGAFLGSLAYQHKATFEDQFWTNLDLPNFPNTFGEFAGLAEVFRSMNTSVNDIFGPRKEWLVNRDFMVGRKMLEEGLEKKHAVVLIPGIVSSGLESWGTDSATSAFFRQRVWGSTSMIRAILTRREQWVKAMSLDPITGIDPEGVKVRAAQGLDAASSFIQGYWVWQKIIENLAVLDYDYNDLSLQAYDWRLSYYNLEERDKYFSRLKHIIEHNKHALGKKSVIVSHSMGALVVLYFLKWVEHEDYGNGGPSWCEDHIESFVNIGGTLFGVSKAMAALLSGEMRDTVELNPAGVYLLEKFFSRKERTKLFRSWAGAASMMLKGGNDVWGDDKSAPDDPDNVTLSGGLIYRFRQKGEGQDDLNSTSVHPNLTLSEATDYLIARAPASYQKMLHTNWSVGFERDPEQLKKNDGDHRKWTNPLETRLPNAPSMKIYCLYGYGKATERAYIYQQGEYEIDEDSSPPYLQTELEDANQTQRNPLDLPLVQTSWIDNSITLDNEVPKVKSGVINGEGDGTVSLLSLGAMCVDGWKRDLYNPAKIPVITREIMHNPQGLDPRGAGYSADHIDILGSMDLNEVVLRIAAGRGDEVEEQFHSPIKKYAARIKWDG